MRAPGRSIRFREAESDRLGNVNASPNDIDRTARQYAQGLDRLHAIAFDGSLAQTLQTKCR
jgi:hypothetical protein